MSLLDDIKARPKRETTKNTAVTNPASVAVPKREVLGVVSGKPLTLSPAPPSPPAILSSSPSSKDIKPVGEPIKPITYAEFFEKTTPYKPLTESELADQQKKEKRQKIASAISDGITALSNVYMTTKGGMPIAQPSLSQQAQSRWERIEAQRHALNREYEAGRMRAHALDLQQKKAEQDWRHKMAEYARKSQEHRDKIELAQAKQEQLQIYRELQIARQSNRDAAYIESLKRRWRDADDRLSFAYAKLGIQRDTLDQRIEEFDYNKDRNERLDALSERGMAVREANARFRGAEIKLEENKSKGKTAHTSQKALSLKEFVKSGKPKVNY